MTKNIEQDLEAKKIGFIGLGLMGAPMVRNLCATDATIYIWNRNPAAAQKLAKQKTNITVCDSPNQVAINCDNIIVMVTDAGAVESVVFGDSGIAEGCLQNSIVIDMGTTSVIETRVFAERLKRLTRTCYSSNIRRSHHSCWGG